MRASESARRGVSQPHAPVQPPSDKRLNVSESEPCLRRRVRNECGPFSLLLVVVVRFTNYLSVCLSVRVGPCPATLLAGGGVSPTAHTKLTYNDVTKTKQRPFRCVAARAACRNTLVLRPEMR